MKSHFGRKNFKKHSSNSLFIIMHVLVLTKMLIHSRIQRKKLELFRNKYNIFKDCPILSGKNHNLYPKLLIRKVFVGQGFLTLKRSSIKHLEITPQNKSSFFSNFLGNQTGNTIKLNF